MMKTMEDYRSFLAEIRQETGIEALTPDDGGLVSVSVDGKYNVNLQFVETTGRVLCFIELMHLDGDTPAAVYRDLLVGGLFGRDTAGGYFAIEPDADMVVYNYFFDLESAAKDVDAFVQTLEKILQLCDVWEERIRRIRCGEAEETNSQDVDENSHRFSASIIRA